VEFGELQESATESDLGSRLEGDHFPESTSRLCVGSYETG
jgi:hypothetical protein